MSSDAANDSYDTVNPHNHGLPRSQSQSHPHPHPQPHPYPHSHSRSPSHSHSHSHSHSQSLPSPTATASRHDQPGSRSQSQSQSHHGHSRPAQQLDAQFHHHDSINARFEPSAAVGTSPTASSSSGSRPAKRRRIEASVDGCVTCRARKVSKPRFLVSHLDTLHLFWFPNICSMPLRPTPARAIPITLLMTSLSILGEVHWQAGT